VRQPIEGEIEIAVNTEPVWPESRRFKLADVSDIPVEGDSEELAEAAGEARWFWAEIPLSIIRLDTPHYVALYSPSRALVNVSSSPILAAGRAPGGGQAWLNSAARGQPPVTAQEALKAQIPNFAPAIALKLVPPNAHAVAVRSFWSGSAPAGTLQIEASVLGQDVERAWLEVSADDGATWTRTGRFQWGPPYVFRHKPGSWKEALSFRACAQDLFGNKGASEPLVFKDGQKRPPER
jgi:hypothetical protein